MTNNKGKFLLERADRFLELGRRLLDEGTLDIAAFHLQQAGELRLKYALFSAIGDYPRTHSLKKLLVDLADVLERDDIEKFLDERIDVVANLQNAYITARYLPGDFREIEVEHMANFVEDLFEFLETL